MQGDVNRGHVWEQVLIKSKHSSVLSLFTSLCWGVEPEVNWLYLLKRLVFINRWSGLNPNRIPSLGHVCDIGRNVWICPGSMSPCYMWEE